MHREPGLRRRCHGIRRGDLCPAAGNWRGFAASRADAQKASPIATLERRPAHDPRLSGRRAAELAGQGLQRKAHRSRVSSPGHQGGICDAERGEPRRTSLHRLAGLHDSLGCELVVPARRPSLSLIISSSRDDTQPAASNRAREGVDHAACNGGTLGDLVAVYLAFRIAKQYTQTRCAVSVIRGGALLTTRRVCSAGCVCSADCSCSTESVRPDGQPIGE